MTGDRFTRRTRCAHCRTSSSEDILSTLMARSLSNLAAPGPSHALGDRGPSRRVLFLGGRSLASSALFLFCPAVSRWTFWLFLAVLALTDPFGLPLPLGWIGTALALALALACAATALAFIWDALALARALATLACVRAALARGRAALVSVRTNLPWYVLVPKAEPPFIRRPLRDPVALQVLPWGLVPCWGVVPGALRVTHLGPLLVDFLGALGRGFLGPFPEPFRSFSGESARGSCSDCALCLVPKQGMGVLSGTRASRTTESRIAG